MPWRCSRPDARTLRSTQVTRRHLARRDAVAILANSMRDWTHKATQKVRDGKARPEDWKDWASVAFHQQMLTAASVQGGGTHVLDSPTLQRRLAAVQANAELRMGSLQERLLLGPDHPDGISLAQANTWGAQAMRGLVRTAGQMGAAESFGDRPVRRGMTAFEAHCLTCPSKAGLYVNLAECIAKCGGWVGDGSDQCHGNCLCYVRPASITSVYGDDMSESLKVRLANLPPRPPTPTAPAQSSTITLGDLAGEPDAESQPLPPGEPVEPAALPVRVQQVLLVFNSYLLGVEDHEEGYVVTLDGEMVGERVEGGRFTIQFELPEEGRERLVVTHNHWRGTGFSPVDFEDVYRSGIYELQVVTPQSTVYRLQRPPRGWPDAETVSDTLAAYEATWSEVDDEHPEWGPVEVSHEVANRVAARLGAGYTRIQRVF